MTDTVQSKFDELAPRYSAKYDRPRDILAFEKQRRMDLLLEFAVTLKPAAVLDAGCGSGVALSQLHTRLPDARLLGVDLSFMMLREAKTDNASGTPFIQSVVEKFPFADNSFDLVYALGVVDYVDNPAGFFADVRRILKPGGYFVFTYPNGDSIVRKLRKYLQDRLSRAGSSVTAKPLNRIAVDALIDAMPGELRESCFITYGNGVFNFPWSVATSRMMEQWSNNRRLSRYLAWSCFCVVQETGG